MRTRTRALIGAAAWLAGAAAALPVWADEPVPLGIVCWTDDHGLRACGDHVPPQYARKQRDVYDKRGVILRTLKAEETPEQRAENERRERDAQRQLQLQEQQQANDNFMLQTYRSVDELKAVRDGRLQSLDTRLQLAEKAVRDGDAALKELQDRADVERDAGRDPAPELEAQIKTFAAAQAENVRAVAQVKQEHETTAAQFEHYIQRFQEIHGTTPLPPTTPLAPPTPKAPAPEAAPRP